MGTMVQVQLCTFSHRKALFRHEKSPMGVKPGMHRAAFFCFGAGQEKTLPKALRTQGLTALTSNFGLVNDS